MNTSNNIIKTIKLVPPTRATKDTIFGFNFGIRPYRKGGIRLERQAYKNKVFYHNYGHGGAGVSLAYGTASHIVELFLKDKPDINKGVAVIGCGYMGLMQSIILRDLGFKVTVYTKDFPKELGVYSDEPLIASQVAGGLWMPFGLDIQDQPQHFLFAEQTYRYYKECIEKKKYQGLSYKEAYMIDVENPIEKYTPPGLLQPREVNVDFGNGKLHKAVNYTTILMDGDTFLKELFEESKAKKVNFVKKGFENIEDLCQLEEPFIFNCSGASSYYLFNDTNIVPIVGHLMYIKKVPGLDYFLSTTSRDGKSRVTLYPQGNKLAVGLTYEDRGWLEKPDPSSIRQLANNLDEFLQWRAGVKLFPKSKL